MAKRVREAAVTSSDAQEQQREANAVPRGLDAHVGAIAIKIVSRELSIHPELR